MSGACEVPTVKFPDGRTGTVAGVNAHRREGEKACEACARAEVERVAKHQRANREQGNLRTRRYAKTEKGKAANQRKKARRRARKLGDGNLVPAGRICVCCRSHENIEVDHVIPISKGGSPDHPSNQQFLCRTCNRSKNDSDTCRIHDRFLGTKRTARIRADS